MASDSNQSGKSLNESECLKLIQFVSDKLSFGSGDSAVQQILDYMRELFSIPCTSIREIVSNARSLRFMYESLDDGTKIKRLGETITFSTETWNEFLHVYSRGYYLFVSGEEKHPLDVLGPNPNEKTCMLQIPMYVGEDFLGTVDFVEFDTVRRWTELEISTLKICCDILCRHLYRFNPFFMSTVNYGKSDAVTGLVSFQSFIAKLDVQLPEMVKKSPVAFVYSDIHHFKYINETYGYQKGDELLKITASAMSVAPGDEGYGMMLARVHSDNFISASPISEELIPEFENFICSQNKRVCQFLRDACPDVRIRINTGIFYLYDANINANTAISHANLARKIAKTEGLRRPLVFEESMMEDIKNQEYLNSELPKAIENRHLKVYYQPKINCADDSLYGAEALVRWIKPDGTCIYPDQFIPTFEKNGNIVDVDFYVYREVFRYLRKRLDKNLPVVPISMNVSRVHFKSNNIIPYIKGLMEEYRIPAELIEFELTENIYIKNFAKANDFIKSCRNMNIKISMDDFGSGYSSLNVMSALPIDTLKIDRVFLKNDELNDSDKTVLECMISMAKRLGMLVICEGVETASQSAFLKRADCDMIQGYYYGKPMDEESFDEFTKEKLGG